MPIRRPRGPKPALRHVAFLEAVEALPVESPQRAPLEAAFLTLRLLDEWMASGSTIVESTGQALLATRRAVGLITDDDATRSSLEGVIDAMVTLQEPDAQPLLPRLFAYAGLLERRGSMRIAGDTYQTVSKYADAAAHFDIAFDSLMRHGFCLRAEGQLEFAARSYESAGALAARERDRSRVLYSRIGVAKVVWARGDLPAADAALSAVLEEAAELNDARLHAVALHDSAALAKLRGDLPRAVRFAFDSFREQTDEVEKERVLNDLANFLAQTGAFETARRALLIMERGGKLQQSRWIARQNLMDLGIRQGSETAFEEFRRLLDSEPLPAPLRASFLRDSGRGFAAFGRVKEAEAALRQSVEIAERHGLHQVGFEANAALENMERLGRELKKNRPAPTPAPDDIDSCIEELLAQTVSAS